MADAPSPSEGASANLNILCQTLPPPGRFPMTNLPLTITIGQLRNRIAEIFPGNPPPATQRLIYQGRALLDDSVTLGAILPSANNSTYALHLVLPPPEPTSAPASDRIRPARARPFGPGSPGLFGNPPTNTVAFGSNATAGSGLFGPTTAQTTGFAHAPAGSSLFGPNAAQRSGFGQASAGPSLFASNRPTGSNLFGSNAANPGPFGLGNPGFGPQATNGGPFGPANNTNIGGGLRPQPTETDANTNLRLANLRSEIDEIEGQLGRGALPSMQHIVNVRTELLGIQYAQFDQQRPLPEVGALIARIMDAYNRACQLESLHFQQRASGSTHNEANSGSFSVTNSLHTSNSVFLLNPTPDGPAQFILSPGAYYVAPPAALDAQSPPQLPQNAAMPENMVRQAIQNQQRRGNNVEQADLARHIGRIWLFVRLWFFCYLISEPGTWRRYIMVAASLLAALLSGTGIPQRIMHAVVNPTLRHVEAFARAGGPADPAPANNDAPRAFTMGEEVRRVHRAVLLLVASIVPGLGEREVEAHHAAEAEAERRRQEQQAQTAEAEAGSTNSTAEQEAPVSQPGPTPAAQD